MDDHVSENISTVHCNITESSFGMWKPKSRILARLHLFVSLLNRLATVASESRHIQRYLTLFRHSHTSLSNSAYVQIHRTLTVFQNLPSLQCSRQNLLYPEEVGHGQECHVDLNKKVWRDTTTLQ